MKELLERVASELGRGGSAELLTIIESRGSAPRGVGACMAVFPNGSAEGTIGGGAIEYEAARLAKAAVADGRSFTESFDLSNERAAALGMICGGSAVVRFSYLSPCALPTVRGALSAFEGRRDAWLIMNDKGDEAKLYLYERGGAIPYGLDESAVAEVAVKRPAANGELVAVPLASSSRVFVFGGGHVSQSLVPVIAKVGFRAIVLEDREEFAREALFPDAERVMLVDFSDISKSVDIRRSDYAVVMTRGHGSDYEALRQIISRGAYYVGCMGSRTKAALTLKRLSEDGVPESEQRRIHMPIGLAIGAETPDEIAVSVAAELIRCRAGLE